MPHSLKIAAAAIVIFTAAALWARSGRTGTPHGAAATSRLAIAGDITPANGSATRPGVSDSTEVHRSGGWVRSWIFFPVGLYAVPVVILAVVLFFKHRRLRMLHETLRAMIEKGIPVTPEVIAALKLQSNPRGQRMCYLLPGLIFLAVGIGLMVNSGRGGLIPLLIGVAFLIVWQVDKRSTDADQPPGE
jgi:hypothetical protein